MNCPETVRELYGIVEERERASLQRWEAQERATRIALEAIDRRLELVNEFRGTLSDQATRFLPREQYEIQHRVLHDQIGINTGRLTAIETALATKKEGLSITGGLVLGAFAVLSSLVSVITLWVHIYKP